MKTHKLKHHIWCNLQNVYQPDDSSDCVMCKGLRDDHPEINGDVDGDILAKRHFPNARRIYENTI